MRRRGVQTPLRTTPECQDSVVHDEPSGPEPEIQHHRWGVWDYYEELPAPKTGSIWTRLWSKLAFEPAQRYDEFCSSLPYVVRMVQDIGRIRECWLWLALYLLCSLVSSLIPALSTWYAGQLLIIVQSAIDERTVDKTLLYKIAAGRIACALVRRAAGQGSRLSAIPLNASIQRYYSGHLFHAMARLDIPTFEDSTVQQQLQSAASTMALQSAVWSAVSTAIRVATITIQIFSQLLVVVSVVRDLPDGPMLSCLVFGRTLFQWINDRDPWTDGKAWAATTKNSDYIRMAGLKATVSSSRFRQEVVAGNMGEHLTDEFKKASERVGNNNIDFRTEHRRHSARNSMTWRQVLDSCLKELPQITFALRAVEYPATIPLSLASVNLIERTASSFSRELFLLFQESGSMGSQLAAVKKLYEVVHIPNTVVDGTLAVPPPEDGSLHGVSVEFQNVCFKYPGSEQMVLDDISFKIGAGKLGIIVGTNGSGKSTILKLISRIYSPTSGTILINGTDIQSLLLEDLRKQIAVLFQDFSSFPLSIRENIGLGATNGAEARPWNDDDIRKAARLGGAEEFVDKLPKGFDTYLEKPVSDHWSSRLLGRTGRGRRGGGYDEKSQDRDKTGRERLAKAAGMEMADGPGRTAPLSGGQLQRLAVSRTFMRSLFSEEQVNVLLFDEPSAALDPTAEHDLFERLRNLRGEKTMIFSTHRFGNLTRHADLIMYMHDAKLVEQGTHNELLEKQGEYARIWTLQARAFM